MKMTNQRWRRAADASDSGSALVTSLFIVIALAGMAAAIFSVGLSQNQESRSNSSQLRALYLAEAGVTESLVAVAGAFENQAAPPQSLGSEALPLRLKGGSYWCDLADNGDGTFTVTSHGRANQIQRTLEAVLVPIGNGVFDHAIFAGNAGNDPTYALGLSGTGAQADSVTGDIYSGNDVEITEDAAVTGMVYSTGSISGAVGKQGIKRPLPDILGMNYAVNHDFDVAAAFASATWQYDDAGGSAWQLPESDPAHIFRKNPDNRQTEIDGTAKDDYFLEDPYEPLDDFTAAYSGELGHTITLSGTMGEPGVSGTNKLYYIDGNLWVHNTNFKPLRFYNSDAAGAKVTFVVKGNVYFSDDVLIEDNVNDGVAFIAIKDDAEQDSGNIYLGDPVFGTIERMEAFLYAENDFYDYNLDATGSLDVSLLGNMTAGNQVSIQRDYIDGGGNPQHSKLDVQFDDRIATGQLTLPGLPKPTQGVGEYFVAYWREIANP